MISKTCRVSGKTFVVTDEDQAFYEKMDVPAPTLCPEERMRRRLAFRNERHLYHRKCDITGRPLVSYISSDKPYKVFDQKEWWGDKNDPLAYGRDFDFSRPFFEQFNELLLATPFPHVISSSDVQESNCLYTNFAGNNKNCYLIFDSDFNEDCQYSNVLKHSKNCLDCSYVSQSELLYECVDCHSCYNLEYSQDCSECFDSWFLKNCIACKNCIGCVNLRQKEFCIFNKQYSKEEYEKFLKENDLGDRKVIQHFRKLFDEHVDAFPVKYNHSVLAENSTGDYLKNVQNVFDSFNMGICRDCRYCDSLYYANDCMDTSSFGEKIELIYEGITIGINSTNVLFSNCIVNNSYNVTYSFNCRSVSNVFACANMKRGSFCILNKQYSKEEYESLKARIIEHMKKTGEWGEFFPIEISPFGYNESMANEFFPMTKDEIIQNNYKYKEAEINNTYQGQAVSVPDNIKDLKDSITEQILSCELSKKPYKLTPQELRFYKQCGIPAPTKSPEQRHSDRIKLRNPRKLWERKCEACGIAIQTSYSPERPEKVYCETCYLQEIY
jgi:hypothetical protein